MFSFVQKTIKPFLIIFGIITAILVLVAVSPKSWVENLLKLEFFEEYKILIQHWGILIFLVGLFMFLSAFITAWRFPIILFATIEKIFIVLLYIVNLQYKFSEGFSLAAVIDSIIVIYFLIYLFVSWKQSHKKE